MDTHLRKYALRLQYIFDCITDTCCFISNKRNICIIKIIHFKLQLSSVRKVRHIVTKEAICDREC